MERMFVRITQVNVLPIANDLNPRGAEKTDRPMKCPPYEIPLLKKRWHNRGNITELKIIGEDMWELTPISGKTFCQSEEARLRRKYGSDLFDRVYQANEEFEMAFKKVASETNPLQEARDRRDEEFRRLAVSRAAKGIMDASMDAEVQAERKKARGRPTKNLVAVDE